MTEIAGLSLALGAFIAGMLISETEFKHRVEDDIKPFRDVLLGLFFVTIGMLLNVRVVIDNFGWVVLALILPVGVQVQSDFRCWRASSARPPAPRSELLLRWRPRANSDSYCSSQAGALRLIDTLVLQIVLAAMLLSMMAAPLLLQYSDRIVLRLVSSEWLIKSLEIANIAKRAIAVDKHVVICGFGRSGQHLGEDARAGGHFFRCARARSRSGARGGCGRRVGRLRRRGAARSAGRGGHLARFGTGNYLCRYAFGVKGAASRARVESQPCLSSCAPTTITISSN